MAIKKICVLGSGTMGHGIAQVCAQAGYEVSVRARREVTLASGMEDIKKTLQRSVERQKMSKEEAESILGRIKTTTNLSEAAKDADLVIESTTEDLEAKKSVFKETDEVCPPDTIFATNTSYQSVTELAAATKRPQRFLGMHWFNPPPLMRGVEVIRTEKTSQETFDTIVSLCRKCGKEPIICKDSPGFIANRLMQPWVNESMKMLDEAVAAAPDVDTAFKEGYSFRMGPLEVRDFGGLEVGLAGTKKIYEELGTEIFRPARSHIMLVRAGDYGRKTGRGFYQYK